MAELFSDLPEALENTVEIAKRCNIEVQLGKYFLPDFPTPNGMGIDDYLRHALLRRSRGAPGGAVAEGHPGLRG